MKVDYTKTLALLLFAGLFFFQKNLNACTIEAAISASICAGQSFEVGNKSYDQPGIYTDTLLSSEGCDSVQTTTLAVLPVITQSLHYPICQGSGVQVNNITYDQAGTYQQVLTSAAGCDSILNINITVSPVYNIPVERTICKGSRVMIGNNVFTQAGIYTVHLLSKDNCDSTVVLDLKVLDTSMTYLNVQICEGKSYVFGSRTLTTTGTYKDTLQNHLGCDSIITLDLRVVAAINRTISPTLCEGQSFTVGNHTYTTSGTYKDTLTSAQGCDSIITLNLTFLPGITRNITANICRGQSYTVGNHSYTATGTYRDTLISSSGCDSIIVLSLTVRNPTTRTQNPVLCEGQSFTVGSHTYTTTGVYRDTLRNIYNCDSIIVTNLTINPVKRVTLTPVICNGTSFQVGDKIYTQTGTYRDTLESSLFCDSIITTQLTVLNAFNTVNRQSICEGASYVFNGNTYYQPGTYLDTLISTQGCDSIIRTVLTVIPTSIRAISRQICQGQSITVGPHIYTSSGTYTDTLTSSAGCDSIVTLTLTVISPVFTTINPEICEGQSFTVGQHVYTASGTYRDTLTAVTGCDSIITTRLTVHAISRASLAPVICKGQSFQVGNKTYTVSGTYTDTLSNFNHCDSIITTQLTVKDITSEQLTVSICQGSGFSVGNNTYTQPGTYRDTLQSIYGCDSIIVLRLSVQTTLTSNLNLKICQGQSVQVGSSTYNTSGTYRDTLISVGGCDSIVTLQLSVLPVYNLQVSRNICRGDSLAFGNGFVRNAGNYTYTYASKDACDSTVNLMVSILEPSSRQIGRTSCEGSSININNVQYTRDTTFSVITTNYLGCDSVITYHLKFNPRYTLTTDRSICRGSTFNNIVINQDTTVTLSLKTIANCDSIVTVRIEAVDPEFTYTGSQVCEGTVYSGIVISKDTIIRQTLTNRAGCDSTVIDTVTMLIRPVLTTSKDTLINPGNNVTIFASGAASYAWNTGATQASINVQPVENTAYTVIGTAANGCTDTAVIQVRVNACVISVPSLFTPNGDGIHDVLKVKGGECLSAYELRIINRWGDVLFESTNYSETWDGTFKGTPVPEGVYFYIISGLTANDDSPVNENGYVHIAR